MTLLRTLAVIAVLGLGVVAAAQRGGGVTVFEGARLITGDGGRAIDDAALVIEGGTVRFAGPRRDAPVSPAATRVNLAGKTIMPGMVSLHGHVGFLNGVTFAAENYTRANVIDHLERYLYYGVVAVMSTGTDPGDLPFVLRDEPHPGALFRTAGRGLAAPNASTGNIAMRGVAYGVPTVEEARGAVRELAAKRPDFVKIWVDDRGGTVAKLSPALYRAIIDESHRHDIRVMAHVYYLADARDLVEAGVDGFLHLVRDQEMDDALVARMAEKRVFVTPNLGTSEAGTYTAAPAWLSDPVLGETAAPAVTRKATDFYTARQAARSAPPRAAEASYAAQQRSLARLSRAGVPIALGNDTGIEHTFFGYGEHRELGLMVAAGMTPMQVIVAATRTAAELLRLDRHGTLAPGKQADFIVLDADPLADIAATRRIAAVYQNGRVIDRGALRTRWTDVAGQRQSK